MSAPAGTLVAVALAAGTAMLTVLVLKGKYGMLALGVLVRICWLVGAVRLAKPNSLWARTFYGEAKMAAAIRRFPEHGPAPHPWRAPEIGSRARVGTWLLVAAVLLSLVTPASGVATGPALVLVRFQLAGAAWARTAMLLASGLGVALSVVPPPGSLLAVALLVVRVALLGSGTFALLSAPTPEPFAAAPTRR